MGTQIYFHMNMISDKGLFAKPLVAVQIPIVINKLAGT